MKCWNEKYFAIVLELHLYDDGLYWITIYSVSMFLLRVYLSVLLFIVDSKSPKYHLLSLYSYFMRFGCTTLDSMLFIIMKDSMQLVHVNCIQAESITILLDMEMGHYL